MQICPANISDLNPLAARLSELGAATFIQAFGHLYRSEDLDYFIRTNHSVDVYIKAIKDPDQAIWYVQDKDRLVGYIKLCPNSLPTGPHLKNAIELSKIYILNSHQNLSLGQKLLDTACEWAYHNHYQDMVLSVYTENYGGQRFYTRNGFKKIARYKFKVGQQFDPEWIMHKNLSTRDSPNQRVLINKS